MWPSPSKRLHLSGEFEMAQFHDSEMYVYFRDLHFVQYNQFSFSVIIIVTHDFKNIV